MIGATGEMPMISATGEHLIRYYRIRNISHVFKEQRLLKQRNED